MNEKSGVRITHHFVPNLAARGLTRPKSGIFKSIRQSFGYKMADKSLEIGNVPLEYERNKELKKEDVAKLMEWAYLQPHLPKITEMQVIHFLHSNNFSAEAAKQCIDSFFTVRRHCPEFFSNRDPKNVELDVLLYSPLPKKTPEGYRIIYARLINTNPDVYNFPIQIKALDMATMLMLNQDGTSEGQVMIHDLTGLTFTHLTKLNPLLLKKFFFYLQECMPVRIKGLHFMNSGSLLEKVLAIIKPFLKKELMEVLYTHQTVEGIYKFVPRECLPSDFAGGTAPSVSDLHKNMKKKIVEHTAFFNAEEKQMVDETKRPGKPKDAGDIFGVEGTFKKLDID